MFNEPLKRHPQEASLIGQIVLGYGELERTVAVLLGASIGDRRPAFRMIFRILGETPRIDAADAMMRHKYAEVGLKSEYADAIDAVKFCLKARNQFAHCHWTGDVYAGLFFANFQKTAKLEDSTEQNWHHIDVALAKDLLAYFEYTNGLMQFLETEYLVKSGRRDRNLGSKPEKRRRPRLYNPPEQHVPPGLSEDERQRHVARAHRKKNSRDGLSIAKPIVERS
ncbi:MAG: hypothetical protein WA459_16505 [Stellaceae bacterium]